MKLWVLCFSFALLSACSIEHPLEEGQHELSAASTYVGCYIDTFGNDYYSPDGCSLTGRRFTTAYFQLFTSATPSHVEWSITDEYGNPKAATCSGVNCSVPIYPGQIVYGSVLYYVVNGTPTQGAYAVAEYEYEPVWR